MAERAPLASPTVYVVDDDDDVRASLTWLIGSVQLNAKSYASAAAFLGSYDGGPGCLLLDVRMPGMTGLELQQELRRRQIRLPVIFITGHGDVPMAVRAVKDGALDFFEKPFPHQSLIERVHQAIQVDAHDRAEHRETVRIDARMSGLTRREVEVMDLIVQGMLNKDVAARLKISVRTVEVHRANIMHKAGARRLADLVRMAARWRRREDSRRKAMKRDPVCGAYVEPRTAHARMEHEGTTYYFCSERCQATFQADPGRYAGKGGR